MSNGDTAVLIVDDEAIVLMSMRLELREILGPHIAIESALDADEGLRVIDELISTGIRLIIVISDWLMPGMKGDEFLILAKRTVPTVITIMVTDQADDLAVERARTEAQLFACIRKPWDTDIFEKTVREAVALSSISE